MDVFRKCLHVFDILDDCVDRSCVCQLSLNEYNYDDDDDEIGVDSGEILLRRSNILRYEVDDAMPT